MTSTILLAAGLLLAAPVPKDAPPAGPAPYILQLKAGTDGKVKLTVTRTETVKQVVASVTVGPNGQQVVQQQEKDVPVTKSIQVDLEDLKDLKAMTADGKDLKPKEAAEKVGNGALVLVSANGQKVDPAYLKLFKDDVVVLTSPDLVPQAGNVNTGGVIRGRPGIALPPVQVQPLPAPAPGFLPGGNIQIVPGGIQIQVAPAIDVELTKPGAPTPKPADKD